MNVTGDDGMTVKRKTHITQFRWKIPSTERADSCERWRALVVSCKPRGFRKSHTSGIPSRGSRSAAGKQDGLPGRFPGAVRYVSFRNAVSVKTLTRHSARLAGDGEDCSYRSWCFRSE